MRILESELQSASSASTSQDANHTSRSEVISRAEVESACKSWERRCEIKNLFVPFESNLVMYTFDCKLNSHDDEYAKREGTSTF